MYIIPSAFLNELAYFRQTVHLDNISKFHSYETSPDESQNNFHSWTLDLYHFVSIIIILRIFFFLNRKTHLISANYYMSVCHILEAYCMHMAGNWDLSYKIHEYCVYFVVQCYLIVIFCIIIAVWYLFSKSWS